MHSTYWDDSFTNAMEGQSTQWLLGSGTTFHIIGIDEADSSKGEVSWISPIARTLLKARVGDELKLVMPDRVGHIEVLDVSYPAPAQP